MVFKEFMLNFVQPVSSYLKPIFKWGILAAILFFLGQAFARNWQEVTAISLNSQGIIYLGNALLLTLLAYVLGGWLWSWILREFNHPLNSAWLIRVYLQTNLAKYLPGNVWHYYGRISKIKSANISTTTASFSVLIEPIFLSAAALLIILICSQFSNDSAEVSILGSWQMLCLVGILVSLHPLLLNPILSLIGKLKFQKDSGAVSTTILQIDNYPLMPLLVAVAAMTIRAVGFAFIFLALTPVTLSQVPLLLSAFSVAWLASIVVPIAPGGIGVFEATAIAFLAQPFPMGVILSVTAVYRLINTIAEAIGAGLASLVEFKKE